MEIADNLKAQEVLVTPCLSDAPGELISFFDYAAIDCARQVPLAPHAAATHIWKPDQMARMGWLAKP